MRSASERSASGAAGAALQHASSPTRAQPHHGVFVRERMRGLPADVEVRVVAPAPWFPLRLRPAPRLPAGGGARGGPGRASGAPSAVPLLPGHPQVPGRPPDVPLHAAHPASGCAASSRFEAIDAHFAYPEGLAAALAGLVLRVPVTITLRGTLPLLAAFPAAPAAAPLRPAPGGAGDRRLESLQAGRGRPGQSGGEGAGDRERRSIPSSSGRVDRTEARRALGLPKYGPLLVSVGTLSRAQGVPPGDGGDGEAGETLADAALRHRRRRRRRGGDGGGAAPARGAG